MALRGTPVIRREDPALLRGQGEFVNDLRLPGAAHVAYVPSPFAHGELVEVDTTEAAAMPGVLAVLTAADLAADPEAPHTYPAASPAFNAAMARPLLADGRVRFAGEAVAVVVAETLAQAQDAVTAVVVDVEPLPAVVSIEDAAAAETLLFADSEDGNVVIRFEADPVADFDGCDVVVTETIANPRVAPCPIEPRVAAAYWEDGRLIHHNAGQGVHPVQGMLRAVYGLDRSEVRVISRDVGGSFGAKARAHPEEVLLGHLARRVGRPVVWFPERSDDMLALSQSRGQRQTITIGGSRDGTIEAYSIHVVQESGAYPMGGAGLPGNNRVMLTGAYRIPSAGFSAESVVTNTTPTGAFRGAGRPEAAAAIERAVDLFAAEIGMDPAEVRRANFVPPEAFPYTSPTGSPYDSGAYEAALDLALDAAGYPELRAEQDRRRASGDRLQLGIGLATYAERTAGASRAEYGDVELLPDGTVRARTGSSPYGQGHHTSWAMLLSDRLGVPMEDIEIVHGDSDEVPRGGITGGSRSVQLAGAALWEAGGELVAMARAAAADLLEAAVDDVELDTDSGRFSVVGTPAVSVGWSEVAAGVAAGQVGEIESEADAAAHWADRGRRTLHAEHDFDSSQATFPFGAHVAVVEVDVDTGGVTLRRLVACDDAGVLLNPLLAAGQVHGGLAAGAAQALMEEARWDDDGTPQTANFADYPVISAPELPSFERLVLETPTPINPLGAKGIGESGTVGATPAVQNAVIDALSHLGIRHLDMPLTPERVWRAVRKASAG